MMVCASAISPPPPRPWNARRKHQRRHARRQCAGDRTGDKNDDRGQHQNAPPVDIGELAVERCHRGAGEQIGRHHPGQVVDIAEMPADGRQRGGDDGLVERAEEHRQHDAEHDGPDFRMRERGQFRRRLGFHRSRLGFRFGGCHGVGCIRFKAGNPLNALPVPAMQD